jgi:hypothetical protein
MSRTYRRLERHLINGEVYRPEGYYPWDFERYQTDDPVVVCVRKFYHFIGDMGSREMPYGIPRWFHRKTGVERTRLLNRQEIYRCLNQGSWDDHLAYNAHVNPKASWY